MDFNKFPVRILEGALTIKFEWLWSVKWGATHVELLDCSSSLRLYCRWQPGYAVSHGKNLEIQFATVQTVNFFANFINAAKMFSCADAIMLCERGLGRAVAYGWQRLINYRMY